MKLLTSVLVTFLGLATRLQLSNAECTFMCDGIECNKQNVVLNEEDTGPKDVFQFNVTNTTATVSSSGCVDKDSEGDLYCDSFHYDNAKKTIQLLSTAATLPDLDVDNSPTKALVEYAFDCEDSRLTVIIYVRNSNDNQAKFTQSEYNTSIPELSKSGNEVFNDIVLTDADHEETDLLFSIWDNNMIAIPFEFKTNFDSFPNTGQVVVQIIVTSSVDYERFPSYNLTLAVNDTLVGKYQNSVTTTSLVIAIEDLDDQDPKFLNETYTASTSEGLIGSLNIQPAIFAQDQDFFINATIKYKISGAEPCLPDSFVIDPNYGKVSVIAYLAAGECEIQLRAEQADDDLRFATAILVLTITDVDNSCPYFPIKALAGRIDPLDNFAYVNDSIARLDLEVRDEDMEFVGIVTIVDDSQPFRLVDIGEDTNPRVVYFEVTDRSSLKLNLTFNLQVDVRTDNCSEADMVDVSITVMNLDPAFTEDRYETSILEEEVYDTPILQVTAVSNGTAGKIAYFLKSATDGGEDYFAVNSSTGQITVPVKTDSEEVERYILFIEAQDSSWSPARISFANVYVTVNDTNDNAPVFQEPPDPCRPINEDYAIGRRVLTVTAIDADKDDVLEYRLETTDIPFVIASDTGEISLDGILDVDAPDSQTEYTLTVVVSDGDAEHDQSVNVTICVEDVNDNAPVFDAEYQWDLPEEEQINDRVFQISATDADKDAEINYTLITYTPSSSKYTFQILDEEIGNITVSGTFDREEQSEVQVIVEASDSSNTASTKVKFMIQDVNDEPPTFDPKMTCVMSSSFSISEDTDVGFVVCEFKATDNDEANTTNTQITYELQDETDFAIIKSAGGEVYQLIVNGTLDREIVDKAFYDFFIVASDSGTPPLNATLELHVILTDVNDNPPVFDQSNMDIVLREEGFYDSGSLVVNLNVRDPDELPNFFEYIASGEDNDLFFVGPTDKGCDVFVKRKLVESPQPYSLVIRVRNPDKPELQDLHSTIRLRIFAGKLQCFQFEPQNPSFTFATPADNSMDFEVVQMNVNYTCTDDQDKALVLFAKEAETYLSDSDQHNAVDTDFYSINETSGILTGSSSASAGLYTITLVMFNSSDANNSQKAYTKVEVRLVDGENVAPQFSDEKFMVPTLILPIEAGMELFDLSKNVTDTNYPEFGNGEVVLAKLAEDCSGCADGQTDIIRVTPEGKLYLAVDSTTLTDQSVNVTVQVQDRALVPLNDTALVSISFRLPSTSPPTFVRECSTPVLIDEELEEDVLVCALQAVSWDGLPVFYSFRGLEPGNFSLDSQTGDIYTTRHFDYDTVDRLFELLVFARTSDSPESFTVVTVQVVDINDKPPVFAQPDYVFEFDEDTNDTDCNGYQWSVVATDADASPANNIIQYTIVGGSEDFNIDPSTGLIIKIRCIDAENTNYTSATISLTVNATNPEAGLRLDGSATVTFTIRDLNDNAPTFDPVDYPPVRIPFLPSFSDMVTVTAVDKDESEPNGGVVYSFIQEEQNANVFKYFTVDADTGQIKTSNVTGYTDEVFGETTDITIYVDARDTGSPPLTSTSPARVIIIFDPTFQNEPYFYEKDRKQETSVPENLAAWCSLFTSPVIPKDSAIRVVYSILLVDPPSATSKFYLNATDPKSPGLCVGEALDRETNAEYSITIRASSCNTTVEVCNSTNRSRVTRQAQIEADGSAEFSLVAIRLFVSDINDANPVIQKDFIDGATKFLIGIPDDTQYGAGILLLQATDGDVDSSLEYTLESDDKNFPKFSFDQSNGMLQVNDILTTYLDDVNVDPTKEQAFYDVTLKVTDTLTTGDASKASAEVQAKIKVLYTFEYAMLVIEKTPKEVGKEQTVLLKCLSRSLGVSLVAERLESHVVMDANAVSTVDEKRTDLWVFAVDVSKDGGLFLKYWDIKKKWDSAGSAVSDCSPDTAIYPVRPPNVANQEYNMIVEIALLTLAGFICVASILMIIAIVYMWDDVKLQGGRQISRKLDMLMLTEKDKHQYELGADNPAFEDDQSVEEASVAHVNEVEEKAEICHAEVAIETEEEPRYVDTKVDAIPVSPLQKGPEHYESQEVVFDFSEFEDFEDDPVSDFAHIQTKEYNGDGPDSDVAQADPVSINGMNEQEAQVGDKSDDESGDKADDKACDKAGDKTDDNADDKTDDKADDKTDDKADDKTGDKADNKACDKADDKTDDKADDKTDDKADDKAVDKAGDKADVKADDKSDKSHEKTDEKTCDKSDDKMTTDKLDNGTGDKQDDKTGDESDKKSDDASDSTPNDKKGGDKSKQDDVTREPSEKPEKDQAPQTPTTPKSVHFDLSERVTDRSISSASSDSTPLVDFGTGRVPDFLEELEVTSL